MHTKSSHKRQTAIGLWDDVGHLKNRNWWEFVEVHRSSLKPSVVTDRCVLLNWFIACFVHWYQNSTWYQGTCIYINLWVIQMHSKHSQYLLISDRASWIDYILITNLMNWLLFIHKILFSSTCFEPQVLIFRRIELYTCSMSSHSSCVPTGHQELS